MEQERERLEAAAGPAPMDVEEEEAEDYYYPSNQVRCRYNHASVPLSLYLPARGLTPLSFHTPFSAFQGHHTAHVTSCDGEDAGADGMIRPHSGPSQYDSGYYNSKRVSPNLGHTMANTLVG